MEFHPIHSPLPVLGEARLRFSEPPYELVTFLNQTLKRRGLIFGLRQAGPSEFELRVYAADSPPAQAAQVEGSSEPRGSGA